MAKCLNCSGAFSCPVCTSQPYEAAVSNVGQMSQRCPDKCGATIRVIDRLTRRGIENVKVALAGASGAPQTDTNGFANYAGLDPGPHVATVDVESVEDRYVLPDRATDSMTKSIEAAGYEFYIFELDPLTSLEVTVERSDRDGLGVKGAKVSLSGANGLEVAKNTLGDDGKVLFEKIPLDSVKLTLALEGAAKERFHVNEAFAEQTRSDAIAAKRTVALDRKKAKNETKFVASPLIYLKLQYLDPEDQVHDFPKGFEVKVVFTPSDASKDFKVLDDEGHLRFEPDKDQTHFTLKFDSDKVRLLNHVQGKLTTELLLDHTEQQMQELTRYGKRFFALPKKWSLMHAAWKAEDITVPKDGKIAIPVDGVGTESIPGRLTLLPKLQYVRFQFHDRKFGKSVEHAKKQVHIPPVILKAARLCDDTTGAPQNPIAGTHDAVGNWMLDKADNAKGCQVVAWVVTKDDAGDDLPKLNNKMLLEFGWENGYVISAGATDRKIETVAATEARRKPGKARHALYDLPKTWRSKCYYTRLPGGDTDALKNKFFNELTEDEVDGSLARSGQLSFSLDDIVLTDNGGSQAVKDKDIAGTAKDLSKHSRVAIIHLDVDDKYKVKVFDPRPESEAAYHSKTLFGKTASDTYRNVLVQYPENPRAVLFCSGVHDIFDKRTATADFSKFEILGARAAKLKDADVSLSRVFNQPSDITKGYVFRTRVFDLHYLHYAATDGTTVYAAMLSHWSCFVFAEATKKPAWAVSAVTNPLNLTEDIADVRPFRGHGLARAMVRWNEKDYEFEQADNGTDLRIKTFCLFEAKQVEDPMGTFEDVGGPPHTNMAVGSAVGISWATDKEMLMDKAQHDVEADWSSDVRTADFDGATRARRVLAHELGHAVIGLFDDYITQEWDRRVPTYKDAQRYPGVAYFRDEAGIMGVNRSPRLRMYWGRANWLNDESATTLNNFLAGKKFRATCDLGGTKFKFELDAPSRNIYTPTYDTPVNVSLGEQGKADLWLYKIGDDEFARQAKGGPYDGILVVEIRVCVVFKDGVKANLAQWDAGQNYVVGNCIEHKAAFYVCTTAHLSADGNAPAGANWFALNLGASNATWAKGADVAPGRWRSEGANWYVSLTTHKTGSRIAANFEPAAGIDQTTLGTDHGAYAEDVAFAVNDWGTFGGHSWRCTVAHTSASLAADVAAKRMVSVSCQKSRWTEAEKQDWMVAADKGVCDMLEATEGKFQLTAAAGGMKKVYVRAFPQWTVKASTTDPDAANTQFSVSVIKGGGAKCLWPTGTAINAGLGTNSKTLARYLLGRLSDVDATRKTQDLTAALTTADLLKLKEWVDARTTGTFTVAAIP